MVTERQFAYSRVVLRLMAAAGVAALTAGCSDASRFADPFSDPFGGSPTPKSVASRTVDRAPTGAISSSAPRAAAPARVETSPLPAASAPAARAAAPAPAPAAPISQANAGGSRWTADGGTPIVVAQGETAAMLATRYGVPTDALLRANGFSSSAQVQPGARLVIPVYRASGAAVASRPAPAAAAPAPVAAKPAAPKVAETKPEPKLEPKPEPKAAGKPVPAKADPKGKSAEAKPAEVKAPVKQAEAKPAPAKAAAKAEAKLVETARAEAKPVKTERIARAAPAKAEETPAAEPVAKAEKREPAKVASAEKPAEPAPIKAADKGVDKITTASIPTQQAAASDDNRPEFRWPARGRIIQGFSSGGNDGINIAVPEGTQVKAAEGGVVAYAGSELKGYGNLVLIRHPNGFVSAYAHNGELEVKRGDQVKRGQTIAKSGQSGNVGSPQLHFELRKGSTPVDPTSYLAGL